MKYAGSSRFIRDDPRQTLWGWDRILTDLFSIVVDIKFASLLSYMQILLNSVHPEAGRLNHPSDVALDGLHACFLYAMYCILNL